MARKREFSEQDVLKAATAVFAEFGYAGSSIDQLTEAMSLQRGSLYKAYASKAGLFRACLQSSHEQLLNNKPEDCSLIVDLLIVAIWERVSSDAVAAEYTEQCIDVLMKQQSRRTQDILYERLVNRAKFLQN